MTVPALEVERAYRRCEQITRREAANFYYGIRLLPRPKRQAMSAVYAFARRVDDIGDGDLERDAQLTALGVLRTMITSLDEFEPTLADDPVPVALAHAWRSYDLPIDALELLIDGVELDVLGARYETFDELVGYCRRVAGSIGRLCLAIFSGGEAGPGGAALADDLGVAMQLTNVVRDIREDQQLGRLYIPSEDLERFGCAEGLRPGSEAAQALIRFEAGRAAQWFDRGLRLTERLDPRSAACVLAMTGIYRTVLERIIRDPDQVWHGRISLPVWEKAWVATRSLAAAALSPGGRGLRSLPASGALG